MAVHVAILLPRYLRLILEGVKRVESRLTRQARPPYRKVRPGERIYFKRSSGPYMATAIAERVEFHDGLTPAKIMALRDRLNGQVCGEESFWQAKSTSRFATFIWLGQIQPTSVGPDLPPSQGLAWFALSDAADPALDRLGPHHAQAESFEVPLTAAALRNHYVRVPQSVHRFIESAYGGPTVGQAGQPLEFVMPDGRLITSDIRGGNQIRWRGWSPYFQRHGLIEGDRVRFVREGPMRYRVLFVTQHTPENDPERPLLSGLNPATPAQPPSLSQDEPTPNRISMSRPPKHSDALTPLDPSLHAEALIRQAKQEDMGPEGSDVTSELTVPAGATGQARIVARQGGRLCGAILLAPIAKAYDQGLSVEPVMLDGQVLEPGSVIAHCRGPLRSLLAMERVALNFLTHLSGIATLTARYVEAVAGTSARILDTRKTVPALRGLAKHAVVCGGGHNHRFGLHDAVLIKDNHLAGVPLEELGALVERVMAQAAERDPRPLFVEVEVDRLEQLERVLPAGPDVALLDNMDAEALRQAVAMRDRLNPRVLLEASGGVNLQSLRAIAATGVDRIAVGALTHSAPSLDIALDIEPAPAHHRAEPPRDPS